jgi:hypothetical protein
MLTHVRRRQMLVAALAGAVFAALGVTLAGSHAAPTAGGSPTELLASAKTLAPLKPGVAYQASSFPLPLRFTAPDASWLGAQNRTASHGRPAFGWVIVAQPPLAKPRGLIAIETAFGSTGSVAATIADLRYGGSSLPQTHLGGVEFGAPTAVKVAGYSGQQFDGQVWGKFGHTFLPFSPHVRGPASPPDANYIHKGEAFRFVVLNVRGKTVVLGFESLGLPADQFPAFLATASRLLKSLSFPA